MGGIWGEIAVVRIALIVYTLQRSIYVRSSHIVRVVFDYTTVFRFCTDASLRLETTSN